MKEVIVDLDGTLANIEHRLEYVKRKSPDWDSFYAACKNDVPNEWCVDLMRSLCASGIIVNIVSARRDSERFTTLKWLDKYDIPFNQLLMLRKGSDNTPDVELKQDWLNGYGKKSIIFVVDDRQRVVDMWRRNGLVCLQAYAWEEYK